MLVFVGLGAIVAVLLQGQQLQANGDVTTDIEEAVTEEAATEEKIVHTFESDEEIQQFATAWQQREAIVLRMAVLQAYWNEEQNKLQQFNAAFAEQFQLDTTKSYSLNTDRKVLIEQGDLPSPLPVGELPASPDGEDASAATP